MFGAINLTFSIRCRYPSVIATAILSAEEDGESTALGRLWGAGGGTGDSGNLKLPIPNTFRSMC